MGTVSGDGGIAVTLGLVRARGVRASRNVKHIVDVRERPKCETYCERSDPRVERVRVRTFIG